MSTNNEKTKIPCKYGSSCYQKNPAHHEKYSHLEKRGRSSPETNNSMKKSKNDDPKSSNSSQDNLKAITLNTLEDKKQFIKDKFLFEMPNDFYAFWKLCTEIKKEKPKEALKNVGLMLVGPFDVLDQNYVPPSNADELNYFLHWRYYYDPPEFQTVIKGDDKTGYHIGYFRDSPEEEPSFVGSNEAYKSCTITQMGDNIFAALNTYLSKMLTTVDPFRKIPVMNLQKKICNRAKELNLSLEDRGKSRKTVCKTFSGVGIVVPYDRNTQVGYRKLSMSEKELRKIFSQVVTLYSQEVDKPFSLLDTVVQEATIANDESDFGTALELGLNMFFFGAECFNNIVMHMLKSTYTLLDRHVFANIIEAHLTFRKKDSPYIVTTDN